MRLDIGYRDNLYLGESIAPEKLEKIKKKLETKPMVSGVFVITLSKNASDQLEIYEAKQLAQKYYRAYPPYVVGITKTKDEAVTIVCRIVQECLDARGDCALKEYLKC